MWYTVDDPSQSLVGQKLWGVVRNVAPFGVFVDVGLEKDGLIPQAEVQNAGCATGLR